MSNKNHSPNNSWQFVQDYLGTIVLCLIFLLAGFFVGSIWTENKIMKGEAGSQPTIAQDETNDNASPKKNPLEQMPAITADDHIRGAENPRLYLVEYSDYECPACQKFHPEMEQVLEEYGDQVAWVYRHYPLPSHPYAAAAAEAAECVAEQGGNEAFWAYTDEIFAQGEQAGGRLSETAIQAAIKVSGVDVALANTCLDNGEMTDVVTKIQTGGAMAGVSGTPGTILVTADGQTEFISGALPFSRLKPIIDKYL